MTNPRGRIDPEFERYLVNLKRELKKNLKTFIPHKEFEINNTQVQRIIANMNKNGFNIRVKKINGKRRRFKLEFDPKTI